MGYKISYCNENMNHPVGLKKQVHVYRIITLFIILSIILFAVGECSFNFDKLLPGDPAVTQAALSKLVADLKEGIEFGNAISAFCMEIIDSAQFC